MRHRACSPLDVEFLPAALIVAGGQSSRMRQPKPWLDLHGTPLLRHIVEVAVTVVDRVVVAAGPGQELPTLPARTVVVRDAPAHRGAGPLAGALQGLANLEEAGFELVYIGACDTPWVDAAHIRFMLDQLHGPTLAAVPETGPGPDGARHLHPLCGAVRVGAAHRTAQELLRAGKRAMHKLYVQLDARRIAVAELPNPQAVLGCDTPEQWQAALDTFDRKPRP